MFASVLRIPFAAIAPMIVVSCAIGAYAVQNAMFDVWLMLLFGIVGYVFKKLDYPLAPLTLALVLGSRTEDAFRLSMIGAGGDLRVLWSNWLVGSITTLALVLLFWPLISGIIERGRNALGQAMGSGQQIDREERVMANWMRFERGGRIEFGTVKDGAIAVHAGRHVRREQADRRDA